MEFGLWIFAIKRLGQTYEAAQMIYNNLSEAAKEDLRKEYDEFCQNQ
ncbi:MAG: hypothetical protein K6G23_06485 [Lachnospiraceae bacterium]|nr:hypothetical protein [Lachnospiraceae bacterium]